jgi:hypothetical protein
MILKIKAKVRLLSEEDLEIEDLDLGTIAKSKEWAWRDSALLVAEIYSITAFSPSKSVIQTYGGGKILIAEKFDDLYEKWQQKLQEIPQEYMRSGYYRIEEDNQDDETFSDDEEA